MAVDLNLLQLIQLSGDQIQSQYIIRFVDPSFFSKFPGTPSNFDPKELSLRLDQQFDPPQRQLGTYEIAFQGLKVTKTSIVDTTDKQFQLQIRMDENWVMYKAMNAWYRACFDDIRGVASPEKDVRTIMELHAYGGKSTPVHIIRFHGVKITNLKPGSFDPAGAEPLRIEASFTYYYQEDITP
jgi:hypothetical protein